MVPFSSKENRSIVGLRGVSRTLDEIVIRVDDAKLGEIDDDENELFIIPLVIDLLDGKGVKVDDV